MGFKEGPRPWFSRGKGTRATGWLTHLFSWLAILLCGQPLFKSGTESWTLTSPVDFCLFSLLTSVPFEKLLQQVQAVNKQENFFLISIRIKKGNIILSGSGQEGGTHRDRMLVGHWKLPPFLVGESVRSTSTKQVLVLNELLIYPF